MADWAIVIGGLAIAVAVAAVWRARSRRRSEGMPYARRSHLLSPAGREFLHVLDVAAGPDYRVFSRVAVADVLRVTRPPGTGPYERAFRRLQSRRFDFVVCKRVGMRIACVVQLDERSRHQRLQGDEDPFLDHVCRTAGLPLLKVIVRRQYVMADLRARVKDTIASGRPRLAMPSATETAAPASIPVASARQRVDDAIKAARSAAKHPSNLAPTLMASITRADKDGQGGVPSCPRCGGSMVRRHVHIGNHPGGDFWSCIRFPRCRGIVPIAGRVASSGS